MSKIFVTAIWDNKIYFIYRDGRDEYSVIYYKNNRSWVIGDSQANWLPNTSNMSQKIIKDCARYIDDEGLLDKEPYKPGRIYGLR